MAPTLDEMIAHVGCGDLDSMVGCPTCSSIRQVLAEAQPLRNILKATIDGTDEHVEAIIRMAIRLIDDPDARLLIRHCAGQGERIQQFQDRILKLNRFLEEAREPTGG